MLDRENLLSLMRVAANATPNGTYSYNGESLTSQAINDTLCKELNEQLGAEGWYDPMAKRRVFAMIEQVADEVVPNKLINAYGQFADIQQYGEGEKPVFKRRTGLTRAKQFITHVGDAGRYEVFQLGSESFTVKTSAVGGAARIGFQEMLENRVNFAELMQIITDGMQELIYQEIGKALMASINNLPTANKATVAGFDEATLDWLVNTATAYGTPRIYCTREFAVKIIPDTGWVSDAMKDQRWNVGYLANYKGTQVVILPQSVTDETNARKVIDPGYAWIIPSGQNDRPVKVAFEGTTHMQEFTINDDWSRDVQIFRKVGVGVMMTNNIFSYVDTELQGQLDNVAPTISG